MTVLDNDEHHGGKIPTSLYKHPGWVDWKKIQGWHKTGDIDGLPILCRNLNPKTTMAYIVGNPPHVKMDNDLGGRLEERSLQALPFLPKDCAFLRWDLMASFIDGSQQKELDTRLLELRMNASTVERKFRKALRETLSMDTMVVNLRGGWNTVHSRLENRVRYSQRLAIRRGTVVEKVGKEGLTAFHALYSKTAQYHSLQAHTESCFRELFASAATHSLHLDLYLATANDKPAASAIIARNNIEAWYLFASSDPAFKHVAGPTAILYQALKDCAEDGIEVIDLLGVAPSGAYDHPLSGLSLFKSGFGGVRKSRAGAWDFVINQKAYSDYSLTEAKPPRSK